jgi:cyanate lyase
MSRLEVTEKIVAAKVKRGLKWADVAQQVGLSKEWVTAACLGQMTLSAEQAEIVGRIFELADGRALQGLAAHGGADRPPYLPLS